MDKKYRELDSVFFESICKTSDDYYYMADCITEESRWSLSAVDDFELPGEYVQDMDMVWRRLVHPDDLEMFDNEMKRIFSGETDYHILTYRARKRNGEYIKIKCQGNVIRNEEGRPLWFSGVMKRVKENIEPLTQLSNIYEAEREIEETLTNENAAGAVMYLGIDDFKRVNDMYTYNGGNELLKKLAERLKAITPPNINIYRLDGDKFGIHFPYAKPGNMRSLYNRIAKEAGELILGNDIAVPLTVSAGVSFYPKDGARVDTLKRNTEYALERAKRQGKKQLTFFSQELLEQYLHKLRMIEAIKKSVKENFSGFELYYQPIVATDTGRIVECEALLRWKNKEFQNAGPADFIPILEETGLIKEVGEWVVRTAVSQAREWGDTRLLLNVNVSYKQLKDGEFADYVLDIIDKYQLDTTKLVVELTESCKAHDIPLLVSTMDKLREKNVNVALDDFGTGYASLGILREVTVDWIKIDHKFVAQCKNNWVDRNIVRHIILLAHALDIKVCVEGIEDEESCQVASEENADALQGYYFSRPVPADEFGRMLEEDKKKGGIHK